MIEPLLILYRNFSRLDYEPDVTIVAEGVAGLPTVLIRFEGLISVWAYDFDKPTSVGVPLAEDSKWHLVGTLAAVGAPGEPFYAFMREEELVVVDGAPLVVEVDLGDLDVLTAEEPILPGTIGAHWSYKGLPERLEALPKWTPSRQWTLDEPIRSFHKDVESGRVVLKGEVGEVTLEELMSR